MKDSEEVQLRQSKLSFKLTVNKELEYKIRTLCSNIATTEWSGILFYRPKGDLDEGTFEVECVDLFLMDIGSSTYTEFETSPEIAEYIADNFDLFDCQTGLIHSHNTMSAFFSGTDNKTLLEQGKENNHFLSLIVNNAGSYAAAITRQVVSEYTIDENRSYKSFGDQVIKNKNKSKGFRTFIEKIEADITVEGAFDFTDRIKKIKDSKIKPVPTTYTQGNLFNDDYLDVTEAFARKEYDKREGWQHGFYQNYRPAPTTRYTKTNKEMLDSLKDTFEYDIIAEILGGVDTNNLYKECENLEKEFDNMSITNQDFKEMAIESLNFYTANYNINFSIMNKILDMLPENRIISTFKSIIADERD